MKQTHNLITSKDHEKLIDILNLRLAGFSVSFIAELYNCDRTSISYHCRKYQVSPDKRVRMRNDKSPDIFNPNRIASDVLLILSPRIESVWVVVEGEKINTGKSYKDYLKAVSPYKRANNAI